MPADGRFPSGTARYEKRAIAAEIPIWDPDICIDCGKCASACPHACIRMKVFAPEALDGAPEGFLSKPFRSKDLADHRMTIQVAPDDCTGCGVCVDVCPAKSKTEVKHKSINMEPAAAHRDQERAHWDFFKAIPELDRSLLPHDSVKGAQALQPLFEFSGACAGCGETPYLKLVSQLFGDRMLVANATGCSSIYGGNLPTTPWATNADGRGPAWANSLFEDNAEFGLGIRMGLDAEERAARALLGSLAAAVGTELATSVLEADQDHEEGVFAQRHGCPAERRLERLAAGDDDVTAVAARHLAVIADALVRKGVWIIGGDGWAYDIGFGGLDHVLSSGRNVNVLVLDTEVYSNTGGQASKATQRGAMAKFAAAGKESAKKDLGAVARAYGNVYVAQISMGANDLQATKALLEAEAYPGPSLVIAYSTCIAHGIDMSKSMTHQKDAVRSGYWPLYRFHPSKAETGQPFTLDSKAPSVPLADFTASEARYATLARTHPHEAARLSALAQADVTERWRYYDSWPQCSARSPRWRPMSSPMSVPTLGTIPTKRRSSHDITGRVDLTTNYLGLQLRSPVVASAGPWGRDSTAKLLADAGVGAIVLPSLFEEEIVAEEVGLSYALEAGSDHFAEALDYFPATPQFTSAADRYLELLQQVKKAVAYRSSPA